LYVAKADGTSGTPDGPTPTPGHSIVPGDGGSYVELDENGTPLGEWRYDPDTGEWIFDEYPPLADTLPQTGNIWERNESRMWMMFFFWLIVLTGLMLLNRSKIRVNREYYF
jgi:hypothetical protein